MSLGILLAEKNIKTALVVDDAFDKIPKALDIIDAESVWPIFNDDLSSEQRVLISEKYPSFLNLDFDQLIMDDDYVATIWSLKEQLGDVATQVFSTYIIDQRNDEKYLDLVLGQLRDIGLQCQTAGRDFKAKAQVADLIIIDLYLGQNQDADTFSFSKEALKQAIKARNGLPPLVILMSRSHRLEAKRDEFRDDVGLLDSAFRIIKKIDLETNGILELQLRRIMENFDDTRRFFNFVEAIDSGLNNAVQRTLSLLRKLKLSDIGQIHDLLLNAEGEPPGSYLVDVFDRVLQHEIERDEKIISTAKELNNFKSLNHPPAYVSGSPGLQDLVARMVSQNKQRLSLSASLNSSVTFGDLLQLPEENERDLTQLPSDLTSQNILLVLTPVCDLQRGSVPRVLLLVGEVCSLSPESWTYGADARTPAIQLNDKLCWIKWDLKHVVTMLSEVISHQLGLRNLCLVGRLRESHALELQQRVFAGLGRVGQVVALPATFPVELSVYYTDTNGRASLLDIPELKDGAVCWVGRDSSGKKIIRLMVTEVISDAVIHALRNINETLISDKARIAFKKINSSLELAQILSAGLELKIENDKWSTIYLSDNSNKTPVGLIAWNKTLDDNLLDRKDLPKAGALFVVKEHSYAEVPSVEEDDLITKTISNNL